MSAVLKWMKTLSMCSDDAHILHTGQLLYLSPARVLLRSTKDFKLRISILELSLQYLRGTVNTSVGQIQFDWSSNGCLEKLTDFSTVLM